MRIAAEKKAAEGRDSWEGWYGPGSCEIYKAMLAAAPRPGTGGMMPSNDDLKRENKKLRRKNKKLKKRIKEDRRDRAIHIPIGRWTCGCFPMERSRQWIA
jgi:hypothetical protein